MCSCVEGDSIFGNDEFVIQTGTTRLDQETWKMAKRGALRRAPGDEIQFPCEMRRAYRAPLARFQLPDVDVAAIRKRLKLSQARFAHRFGFSVATLRHWEQGNRRPRGCALALLHIIDYHPAVATRAILGARARDAPS
jgi:putative transcriptional regulator